MITLDEARRLVLDRARCLPAETVAIHAAVGRVLAEDVVSDVAMPPFHKAAMDGYACRREDLANALEVIETLPAGAQPTRTIGPNQCARIMTGAPVPEGADTVVMVEYTAGTEDTIRFTGHETADNICMKGEDTQIGDVMLRRGECIAPRHIPLLAAVGCTEPAVSRQPVVGIMATGDELVEPDRVPGPSKIRNTNACQLQAQVAAMGARPVYCGIARDTAEDLADRLQQAVAACDVLLLSGGVSAGDYDLVPDVLRAQGFELLFEKLATKPGKPTVFGVSVDGYCFGLPGNPVSTYVIFENLVKPFLFKLMGHDYRPADVPMTLGRAVRRGKTAREAWLPVRVAEPGVVVPVDYHGSAHVRSLVEADGLIRIPIGVAEVAEGTSVVVRPL